MNFLNVFLILPIFCGGSVYEKILQWWKDISILKPYQCKINGAYQEPFPTIITEDVVKNLHSEPYIISRPCQVTNIPHTFRGEIVNGKFEGPGKLRVFTKGGHIDVSKTNQTCIVSKLNIKEVVGNFKNGVLNGKSVKIKLQDNSTIIGSFQNGVPFGPMRFWDAGNQLQGTYQVMLFVNCE